MVLALLAQAFRGPALFELPVLLALLMFGGDGVRPGHRALAVMVRDVCADVLLGLAVVIVASASLGVLLMRDAYQKLHYVTPAALVAPVLVALAVLVRMGLYENTGGDLPGPVLHGHRRTVPVARDHAGHPGPRDRGTGVPGGPALGRPAGPGPG